MVIFDLDQTLADTSAAHPLRLARKWDQVLRAVPSFPVFEGIHQLLSDLHDSGRPLAILTKNPDKIPRRFIELHAWPITTVIGWHQVKNRKPHPEGLLLAMEKAGVGPEDTVHVGDDPNDTLASRAAGVTAVGAGWGLADVSALQVSKPDHLFRSVAELRELLKLD
jgi:HAD superfamily hydrolase (TIGR01549 family)